jgi:hypothetical protein
MEEVSVRPTTSAIDMHRMTGFLAEDPENDEYGDFYVVSRVSRARNHGAVHAHPDHAWHMKQAKRPARRMTAACSLPQRIASSTWWT